MNPFKTLPSTTKTLFLVGYGFVIGTCKNDGLGGQWYASNLIEDYGTEEGLYEAYSDAYTVLT